MDSPAVRNSGRVEPPIGSGQQAPAEDDPPVIPEIGDGPAVGDSGRVEPPIGSGQQAPAENHPLVAKRLVLILIFILIFVIQGGAGARSPVSVVVPARGCRVACRGIFLVSAVPLCR